MNLFGKPQNIWGWVRILALAVTVVAIAWTGISLFTPGLRTLPWMAWSGTSSFSLIQQIELALTALILSIAFRLMERETVKMDAHRAQAREARRAAAALRKEKKERAFEAIRGALAESKEDAAGPKVLELAREVLPDLDGRGRGELLCLLHENGLLSGADPQVELTGTDFSHAVIYDAKLEGICLDSVDLTNIQMDEAQLANSHLAGVNMSISFLRNADLRGATLARSNLRKTRFEGSNLEGADLRDTRLNDANLMRANLKNCILSDADASRVDSLALLEQAILVDTILPDGRKVTNDKGREFLRQKEMKESLGMRA